MAAVSLAQTIARPGISREQLVLWLTGLILAGWTLIVVAGRSGAVAQLHRPATAFLYLLPGALGLAVLLWRPHSPDWARLALGWSLTVAAAVLLLPKVGSSPVYALVPVALVAGAAVALRWPLPTILVTLFLAGTYRSLQVFTPLPPAQAMDLLLAALWLALLYSWFSGRREPPAYLSPVLYLLILYLATTVLAVFLADDFERAVYAFRLSGWLMMVVFLVGMWATDERRRLLLQRGALVVGAVVGAYAMLRWAIGPAAKEASAAREDPRYVTNDIDVLRLFGSLPGPQALSVWSASMLGFSLASALSPLGRGWRLLAAAVAVMAGASIFGADVRFGMVAGVAGAAAVVVVFAVGRGFSGRRALPLALILTIGSVGIGVFVTTKLEGEGSSQARFKNLVTDPIADMSVQQRFVKWRSMLAEIEDKPFGAGLGASGAGEKKYARFTSAATADPDSSYIKIAYDQGFFVLAIFGAALLSLLLALAFRAVDIPDPVAAGRALASFGALVAFIVAMSGANYVEGLIATGPWTLIAIGAAAFVLPRRTRSASAQRMQPDAG